MAGFGENTQGMVGHDCGIHPKIEAAERSSEARKKFMLEQAGILASRSAPVVFEVTEHKSLPQLESEAVMTETLAS